MKAFVLYNGRAPQTGEVDGVDYHFRPREHIESLNGNERFVVMDVRGDLQAVDLQELSGQLTEGNVFFEGNPFVGGPCKSTTVCFTPRNQWWRQINCLV
jgi:guanylate kinase